MTIPVEIDMSDDELTAEQLYHLRQEVQRGKAPDKKNIDQTTTANYSTEKAEIDALVAASKEGREGVAESTAMLSRDDLFQNAAQDRALRRERKETVRADSPTVRLQNTEAADKTMEVAFYPQEGVQSLDATMESDAYVRSESEMEEKGTTTFSRAETVETDKIEFPVRLVERGAISVPREVIDEFELDTGDLLIVTLRKVRG